MDQDKELQIIQEDKQQLQVQGTIPHFSWPSSKPGPQITPPPPGQSPMPRRTDQVVELGYNQETGTPATDHPLRSLPDASLHGATSFDQPTAQNVLEKRKK